MAHRLTLFVSGGPQSGKSTLLLEVARHLKMQCFEVIPGKSLNRRVAKMVDDLPKVHGWPRIHAGRGFLELEPTTIVLEELDKDDG